MAPSYRHVILESQHVAIETHGGAGGAIQKPSENLSDCGTAPCHRFFLVRDEGAIGPNPPRPPASCCDGETERNRANGADRAPRHQIFCFFAQGLCPSISTLRLNLSRAILGRGSNKPERRHRGPPLLLWTAGHRLTKPTSSHAIRARMTPKHSPHLE